VASVQIQVAREPTARLLDGSSGLVQGRFVSPAGTSLPGASGDDDPLPSSRPVLERLVRAMCARCICAWQTRPFRPPGLSREQDRKPAISITGKQTGDTQSNPAISIAGIGTGRRSSADIDRIILQDRDTGGQIVEE
jgi:hypothetical protein